MILFGPSGNSEQFYEAGYKHTYEAMAWIRGMGLGAYEYSFGRGVRIGEQTAAVVREKARENEIAMSVHAPYFINLATDDPEKREKNLQYFLESAKAAKWLGADRVIFHPGSCAKLDRALAFDMTKRNFAWILQQLDEAGQGDLTYCPETMGKINQLGDLDEVLELCALDGRLVPCIDFGHLYARSLGADDGEAAFSRMLDRVAEVLGPDRAGAFHSHFSHIEFTPKGGEKCHRTFDDDDGYGPSWPPLAAEIACRGWSPTFICESAGTQAEDARTMKETYQRLL